MVIPAGAVSGPLVVMDSEGQLSAPFRSLRVRRPAVPKRTRGPIATVVTGRRAFVDGELEPTLTFRLNTPHPADVTVSVVRRGDGKAIRRFRQGTVAPGELGEVAWDGTAGGRGPHEGRFAFVVSAIGDSVRATTAQAPSPDAFVGVAQVRDMLSTAVPAPSMTT